MKKDDEFGENQSIFHNLDKSSVLQEARVFNETPIRAGRCSVTLTKVLYLIYQGENLNQHEATELFFQVTKLFQSKDVQLRRLVYLVIKELSGIANDVIMATSSLTKDMNDRIAAEFGYRANALRALVKIIEPSMVQAIERFIKQAIVDRDPAVSSAALTSAIHLYQQGNKDIVKRWVNEVQETISRGQGLIQYHSLGLMYQIKQQDKMAISKLIQQMSRGNTLRSPLSYCMIIRYTSRVIDEDGGLEGPSRGLFEILENCLRHRHEMVNLEAARAICSLRGVTMKEIFPATSVLQLFLNSPKPTLRFAAIRTLNKLASTHPNAVVPCNIDIENLITDPNRGVATFAITTLLKTGNEASVDRLMKQITGFMSDITDEFKTIVVEAIRALCLKFPSKQNMMLQFLANSLRDEGGYEYKKAIVEGIFDIISAIPESKDAALSHLCEFIEDCEFSRLAIRILHVLGEEGPTMPTPTKYIRYIYNRTILENASIRAAAVSALAKFATAIGGETKRQIKILLNRCLEDPDDEVRDRAIMYLNLFSVEDEESQAYISEDSTYVFEILEDQLLSYVSDKSRHGAMFDMAKVPMMSRADEKAQMQKTRLKKVDQDLVLNQGENENLAGPVAISSGPVNAYKDSQVENMPEFSAYGNLFRSSNRTELTETDVAEYVVYCIKHIFEKHIVFQFVCKNTLEDVMLENVSVIMESEDGVLAEKVKQVNSISIPKLSRDEIESCFVVFEVDGIGTEESLGSFTTQLKFLSKDCDPQTGEPDDVGFDDSYQMDDVELAVGDYILPIYSSNFSKFWKELGDANEIIETLQLSSVSTIAESMKAIRDMIGMSASENSDKLPSDKVINNHTLLLTGMYLGDIKCACRVRMACLSDQNGVAVEFAVRSGEHSISQLISECIL